MSDSSSFSSKNQTVLTSDEQPVPLPIQNWFRGLTYQQQLSAYSWFSMALLRRNQAESLNRLI